MNANFRAKIIKGKKWKRPYLGWNPNRRMSHLVNEWRSWRTEKMDSYKCALEMALSLRKEGRNPTVTETATHYIVTT